MQFRGTASQLKNKSDEEKLEYDLELHKGLTELYNLVTKLAIVCLRRKIPLMIENPYSTTHYLVKYWAIPATFIDYDRTLSGDYYKKPTQYWFINCEPKQNLVFDEPIAVHERKRITSKKKGQKGAQYGAERSLISKDYARRFIKEFIL